MWIDTAYALGGGAGGGGPGGGGCGQMIAVFGMIFAIMYFLMIRPQQKKQAEHRRMLDGLAPGDQVLTSGGLYGIVSKIREDKVWLDIAENVRVRVQRSNVASVIGRGGAAKSKAGDDEDEDDDDE